jgi:hypothetical protein
VGHGLVSCIAGFASMAFLHHLLCECGPAAIGGVTELAEPIGSYQFNHFSDPIPRLVRQAPTSDLEAQVPCASTCITTALNIESSVRLGSVFLACAGDLIRRMAGRKLCLYNACELVAV